MIAKSSKSTDALSGLLILVPRRRPRQRARARARALARAGRAGGAGDAHGAAQYCRSNAAALPQ